MEAAARLTRAAGSPAAAARQDVTLPLPAAVHATAAAAAAPLQAEWRAVELSTRWRLFGAVYIQRRPLTHAGRIFNQFSRAALHETRQQQRPLQRHHLPPLLHWHLQQHHHHPQQQRPQQQHPQQQQRPQEPHMRAQQQPAFQQQLPPYPIPVVHSQCPGRPPSLLATSYFPLLPPGRGLLAEQQRSQLQKTHAFYCHLHQGIAAAPAGQLSTAAKAVQRGTQDGTVRNGAAASAQQAVAAAAAKDGLPWRHQHRQWHLEHRDLPRSAAIGEARHNRGDVPDAAAYASTSPSNVIRPLAVRLHQRQQQVQQQATQRRHREEQQKYQIVQQRVQQQRMQQQPQRQQDTLISQQRTQQQAQRVPLVAGATRAEGGLMAKKTPVTRPAADASSPSAAAANGSRLPSAAATDCWGHLRFSEALALGALQVIDQDLSLSAIENGLLREQQQLRRQQQQQSRQLLQQQHLTAEQQQQVLLHQQHLQQEEQQWGKAHALHAHVQQHPSRPNALTAAQQQLEKRKRLMKVARANLLLAVYADLFLAGAAAGTVSPSGAGTSSSLVALPSSAAGPTAATAVPAATSSKIPVSEADSPTPAAPLAGSARSPFVAASPVTAASAAAADSQANASVGVDFRAVDKQTSHFPSATAASAAAAGENSAAETATAAAAGGDAAAAGEPPAGDAATPTCAPDPCEAAATPVTREGAGGKSCVTPSPAATTAAPTATTTRARGARASVAAADVDTGSTAGGRTAGALASRRRLLEENEKAEKAAQQNRYALLSPLPRFRVLRLLEWLPASLRAASKGAADAALPATVRDWMESAAFAGDGQQKQQQKPTGIFQPSARVWFQFFVRLQQLHAHGVPLAQFPRFIPFMRSALPTFPHFFGDTTQPLSIATAYSAAAAGLLLARPAWQHRCSDATTTSAREDRSASCPSAAAHAFGSSSAATFPSSPASSSSCPSRSSSLYAAAEGTRPDLWWQLHASQRRFLIQALAQMNFPYTFLALFQRELNALPLDGRSEVCTPFFSFSSSASPPLPISSSSPPSDSFTWLATLIPALRGSALVMYDQLRLPRGLQAAIAQASAPRAADTHVGGHAAAAGVLAAAAAAKVHTGAGERAGAATKETLAAAAPATTVGGRVTPAEGAARSSDASRRETLSTAVTASTAASGAVASRSEAGGSAREFSATLRAPRTLDEPQSAEAYARASQALLSCWHELWCRMQQSPSVPPQAKLQFFFHALPWAPVMQKTCDDVHAHMGSLRVHELASLACSARIRQVHLLRLFHHLRSLHQQEQQEHQPQQRQGAQDSLQQTHAGVVCSAAVEHGADTLKNYASLWAQHLAGAPPLLCMYPGLQGQWKHLLEGLSGAWNLFGDTLASLESMQELLTDVDFPWAMMEEPECVWLRHAAQLRVFAEGSEARQAATASAPPHVSLRRARGRPLDVAAAACLPHPAGDDAVQKQVGERHWDLRCSGRIDSNPPAAASEGQEGGTSINDGGVSNMSTSEEHAGELDRSRPSELPLFEPRSAALLRQHQGEWLSLPRAVLALEHIYSKAATALCQADPNEAAEVFQYRPQTFVALMLVASFPSPCASIQTFDACEGMSASALPATLMPSPASRNALFVPCRLPPSPPLFQKMQEHIFHIAPFPAEGSKGSTHMLAALVLLCARWRRLSETRSRTLEDFAAVATLQEQQRPQRLNAWAAEESRFLNQVFQHIRTLTEVWYMAAVQNPGLRDQGVRQLLAIQQVLREVEDVSSGRFLVNKLKERPTPGKAGYAACLLAALTNCQTPSAASLKLDILELLGTWCFRAFLHGSPTWPGQPVGSPFDPVPVLQYDPLHCRPSVRAQQRRIAAASIFSSTAPLSVPLPVYSAPAVPSAEAVSSAAGSSPSACAVASLGSPLHTVLASSPVPLLTYQQLVALDTSPLLSQSEMSFTFMLSTSYFFQVLFDAALRPPGALPSSRLQHQVFNRTVSVNSTNVSTGVSNPGSGGSGSSRTDTASASSRSTGTGSGGKLVREGDRGGPAAAPDSRHAELAETGRKGKQSVLDSRGGKQWTGWLAADADVDLAFHLPLLLPKLLHMWKRRLLAPQQLPFKSFLWAEETSSLAPHDVTLPARGAAASAPLYLSAHAARPLAPPVSRLKEEEKRPIDFPVPALVLFLCRAARVPVEELIEEGFKSMNETTLKSPSQKVSSSKQPSNSAAAETAVGDAGVSQLQQPALHEEAQKVHEADPQTAGAWGERARKAGAAAGANTAEDDMGADMQTEEVFCAAGEPEKDGVFTEGEDYSTTDGLPGEDDVLADLPGEDGILADLGLQDLEQDFSLVEAREQRRASADERQGGARAGEAGTATESGSNTPAGKTLAKNAALALSNPQCASAAVDQEKCFTPKVSTFAKPLRKLSLASIALAMTVIDEELQCVSRVCRTVQKPASAEAAALSAIFSPFTSAATYRTALSSLYEAFDLLFLSNLASAPSFQLQELVKETRRLTVLPGYLPFPDDCSALSEEIRSCSLAFQSAGDSAADRARIGEWTSGAAPLMPQNSPDGPAAGAAAGEVVATLHPLEALRERAHRERSCYFHGAALQALLLRLAGRQQSSATREAGSDTAAAAVVSSKKHPVRGDRGGHSFCEVSETPQAGKQIGTPGDLSAQQDVVERWQLFELLLQMLSGAPAAVRQKVFPSLLKEVSMQERGDCAVTTPGAFLQQGFQALCDVLPLLSLSHLARLALVVARLDLLRCSATVQNRSSLLLPLRAGGCSGLAAAVSSGGTRPRGTPARDASLQHTHLLLDWEEAAARRTAAQHHRETGDAQTEHRFPWREERTAAASTDISRQARENEAAFFKSVGEQDSYSQAKRVSATAVQNMLEAALRRQLGNHGHELPFSDVTMLLWALTVMPQPKPDILFLLFDRLESILSLLLKEKRFLAGADNLPPQLPYPTASPIFRFLQGQLMTHCARLRAAWASLIMEGDPSLTASLQKRFPLTWIAFQLLQSEVYLAERTMLTETYLFPGFRGKRQAGSAAAVLPLVQFLLKALEKHGVHPEDCAFNVTIPGLPFRYNLAVPTRRLLFIVGCHCAHSTATLVADDPLHSVGHIIADTVNYTPTAALAVMRQPPCRSGTSPDTRNVLEDHVPQPCNNFQEVTNEEQRGTGAGMEAGEAEEATVEQGQCRKGEGGDAVEDGAVEWQLVDCVIGEVQSATHSAAADARSAGGRQFIKRLTKRAGYRVEHMSRLVEVDTSNAGAIEALLADVLEG